MLRLSPPGHERLLQSPELRASFGGCEANVAVGLAHLGVRGDYVRRLADSLVGAAALQALKAEGVGTERMVRGESDERIGIYFVEPGADIQASGVVDDRARSAFAHIRASMVDWNQVLEGATWFHGSGITPALGEGPHAMLAAAIATARARGAVVSLDLNYRPALWQNRDPRPIIEPLVRETQLLIGNRNAVRAMLGIEADDATLAPRLADRLGCRRVALAPRQGRPAPPHRWSAGPYEA